MESIERRIRLSAIHVHWSRQHAEFTATSDQFPGVAHRNECSLAAIDGLIDRILQMMPEAAGIA